MAESWLMRRSLLRLTLADAGRVIAEAIRVNRDAADEDLVDRVSGYFSRLDAESTYWPGDEELQTRLLDEPAYRRFKRGRLRMFLEVAEDHLRGYTSGRPSMTGSRVPRQAWHIEHLLPQKWQDNWPVEGVAAASNREAHIQRLGNLTLLTGSLNARVSNGPWLGERGKRARLADHDVFLMNRAVRNGSEAGWTEELIDDRTQALIEAFIATWPVPVGHLGQPKTRATGDVSSVSLKHLIDADLIPAGTLLTARSNAGTTCEVLPTGDLALDGKAFGSPSAAGHHVRRGATNG